ncbi:MAG: glycosyltransferase family 39 protein [Candidatus Moranbacteria bacterium]|nr:glycosyltransferase family 39 protein [Candidatus Moranbacteria bacterium]
MSSQKIFWTINLSIVTLFLAFGMHNIGKFETTDEHFWKYDRIEKYWNGIKEQNWKKTRVNDKPGITIALLSGIRLPFAPDPDTHRNTQKEKESDKQFRFFNEKDTVSINTALRLPILTASALMLILIAYLIQRITRNIFITSVGIVAIGLSPVLLGISQIINPDALLWSTVTIALLAHIAFLKTSEKKFVILSGIFTGFALLSKYTASLLLPFMMLIVLTEPLFRTHQHKNLTRWFRKQILALTTITAIGYVVFAILMPAVFLKPEHFFYGTLLSPALKPIIIPLLLLIITVILDTWLNKAHILSFFYQETQKHSTKIAAFFAAIVLIIFSLSLWNAWTHESLFPLNNIKEESRQSDVLTFQQLGDVSSVERTIKGFLILTQNFVFSLMPLTVLFVLFACVKVLIGKAGKSTQHATTIITIISLVFFTGGLVANIFVNARYVIVLYPLFGLLAALGAWEGYYTTKNIWPTINKDIKTKTLCGAITVGAVTLCGIISLWNSKPHYFNYQSPLLPKKYNVTDSWGYGSYEASQFINNLPDSEEIITWTDHEAPCQFLTGKCVHDAKIDYQKVRPDYLIITRRGSITRRLKIKNTPENVNTEDFYSSNAQEIWRLNIASRPENFVRVVKTDFPQE